MIELSSRMMKLALPKASRLPPEGNSVLLNNSGSKISQSIKPNAPELDFNLPPLLNPDFWNEFCGLNKVSGVVTPLKVSPPPTRAPSALGQIDNLKSMIMQQPIPQAPKQ